VRLTCQFYCSLYHSILFTVYYGKNGFADVAKNLATYRSENDYVRHSSNVAKIVDIAINWRASHNYVDD
jgi:hypothetical protein